MSSIYLSAALYDTADWWRTGTCGQCAFRMTGIYDGHDATHKKCIIEKTEPACPAGVRR